MLWKRCRHVNTRMLHSVPQRGYKVSRQVLRTVGKCIYCGSNDELSDEHIVPYGLGAEWVLKEASCKKHRDITSKFELEILRGLWGPIRAATNVQSRRGHKGKRYPVTITQQDGRIATVHIDPAKFGAPMHYLMLPCPRYLSGEASDGDLSVHGRVTHVLPDPEKFKDELRKAFNPKKVDITTNFRPVAFAQLLAKIGYGFAVGKYGLEGMKTCYLLDAIDTGVDIGRWVGCLDHGSTSQGKEHIEIEGGFINTATRDIVVQVRLFGKLRSPTYIIIVGEPKSELVSGIAFPTTASPGLVKGIEIIRLYDESQPASNSPV